MFSCNTAYLPLLGLLVMSLMGANASAQYDETCPTAEEAIMIGLINGMRADSGLTELDVDSRLMTSGRRHATDMATNNFLSYDGSDGSTWWQRQAEAGYTVSNKGELIGANPMGAEMLFTAYVASDPHRAMMLDPTVTHFGVGHAFDAASDYRNYYTIDLGGDTDPADVPYCDCCEGRVGDANGEGGDEPTIGDVSTIIDALFISGNPDPIDCLAEADVNQSGGANPPFVEVTIGDVSTLIDYLFITGSSLGLPDCL